MFTFPVPNASDLSICSDTMIQYDDKPGCTPDSCPDKWREDTRSKPCIIYC